MCVPPGAGRANARLKWVTGASVGVTHERGALGARPALPQLRDGAAAPGMSPLGHGLGDKGASQGRRPKDWEPSCSRLCHAKAAMGLPKTPGSTEEKHPCPKAWGILAGGPLGPTPPSGGDEPGASPSDKGRWDCPQAASPVWELGATGAWLTLKPCRAHMSRQPVTTTSCYSRLETERDRERQRQQGWGRPNYLLQPKVGMGLFLTPRGVYLLFQPGGGRECLWDTPRGDIGS